MSWANKRKRKIQLILVAIIIMPIIFLTGYFFYSTPTCYDGTQNQDEDGIDCGGQCDLVCGFKIVEPIVQWSRILKTADGIYSVIAMVENLNISAEAKSAQYVFRLYDEKGILISERIGRAFIPAGALLPIYEGGIITKNRIPSKVNFEFLKNPKWTKGEPAFDLLSIKNIKFTEKNNSSRVSALIENNVVRDIYDIELVVLMFDINNNLINSSKTTLDLIKKNSAESVIFTWPEIFDKKAVKIDIVPVSKIDSISTN